MKQYTHRTVRVGRDGDGSISISLGGKPGLRGAALRESMEVLVKLDELSVSLLICMLLTIQSADAMYNSGILSHELWKSALAEGRVTPEMFDAAGVTPENIAEQFRALIAKACERGSDLRFFEDSRSAA